MALGVVIAYIGAVLKVEVSMSDFKEKTDLGEQAVSVGADRFGLNPQRGFSFEESARLQGVGPVESSGDLLGGWPGEGDDGFEEAVIAWRKIG